MEDFTDSFVTMRTTRQGSGGKPLARTTREKDYHTLKNHILPDIGGWVLAEIQTRDIEELIDSWASKRKPTGEKYKPSSINTWIRVLVVYLKHAYRMSGLDRSPVMDIKTLPEPKADRVALTTTQLSKLLAVLKADYPQWYAMAFVGFATGARFSEISALHWDDIDEDKKIMTLGHSQYRGTRKALNKVGRSVQVPLVEELAEVLRWHRLRLIKEEHPGLSTPIVFPARTVGVQKGYISMTGLRGAITAAAKQAGVPDCGIHGMRRTFVSIWLTLGHSAMAIQAFTAHSSDATTLHYSHISMDDRAKPLQGYLGAITPK